MHQSAGGTSKALTDGCPRESSPAVAMIFNQPLSVIVTFPSDNVSKIDQSATGPLVYHTQRVETVPVKRPDSSVIAISQTSSEQRS